MTKAIEFFNDLDSLGLLKHYADNVSNAVVQRSDGDKGLPKDLFRTATYMIADDQVAAELYVDFVKGGDEGLLDLLRDRLEDLGLIGGNAHHAHNETALKRFFAESAPNHRAQYVGGELLKDFWSIYFHTINYYRLQRRLASAGQL